MKLGVIERVIRLSCLLAATKLNEPVCFSAVIPFLELGVYQAAGDV